MPEMKMRKAYTLYEAGGRTFRIGRLSAYDGMYIGYQLLNNALLLTPLLIAASLWGITVLWLFPLLDRRSTDAPGALLRSAFLLGLGELWRSLLAILVFLIPTLLLLFLPRLFWTLSPVWMLAGFSLPAWIAWRFLEPVLNKPTP